MLREWQHQNYKLVTQRLSPWTQHDTHLFALLNAFPHLHLNPWLDYFEVLAFGWLHGAIAVEDIRSCWASFVDRPIAIPDPRHGSKQERTLLLAFLRAAESEEGEPSSGETQQPFRQFPVLVDVHWQFRRDLPKSLYGLFAQNDVNEFLGTLSRSDGFAFAERWLESPEEEVGHIATAFRGLFGLYGHLQRFYSVWDGLAEQGVTLEFRYLYESWNGALRIFFWRFFDDLVSQSQDQESRT